MNRGPGRPRRRQLRQQRQPGGGGRYPVPIPPAEQAGENVSPSVPAGAAPLLYLHRVLFTCRRVRRLFPRAYRTAALLGPRPGADHRSPFVPLLALPPHLAMGAGRHHLRQEAAVLLRVPLLGQQRLPAGKVVEPRQHLLPHAVRTSATPQGAERHHPW